MHTVFIFLIHIHGIKVITVHSISGGRGSPLALLWKWESERASDSYDCFRHLI